MSAATLDTNKASRASPHPPQTPLDYDGIPGCPLTVTKKALEILSPGPPPPKDTHIHIPTHTN